MRPRTLASVLAAALMLLSTGCQQPSHDFTPWMTSTELNRYLEDLDANMPEGKNFWDRGNRITAAEGRWHQGTYQFRIAHEPVPQPRRAHWWFWYINQPQSEYGRHLHRLADEGFTLVHHQSFTRPDGEIRYQGV